MALKLMYITNNPRIAQIAEKSGVDWIFVDLEIKGKMERQGHLDTVISNHKISDIRPLKKVLTKSKLLVRVNPIHNDSDKEINAVIQAGAEIVMLPYFKTKHEVANFIKMIDSRVETCLLLETPEAVDNLDDILQVKGIDYVHIGLNDLHIGYNMKFMFELLSDGTVEKISSVLRKKSIKFGFGGIAQIGEGLLPSELIIVEHHRLGSELVILSRTFFKLNDKNQKNVYKVFSNGVMNIRNFEKSITNYEHADYEQNRKHINQQILKIINNIYR